MFDWIEQNKELAPFTSWEVGGAAQYFCSPKNLDQLKQAVEWSLQENLKLHILGGGTNLLVSDQGVRGLVLHTGRLSGVEGKCVDDRLVVSADCGAQKSEVLKVFLKHSVNKILRLAQQVWDTLQECEKSYSILLVNITKP